MEIVNLSDKLSKFAKVTLTDKYELVLFHQTNKPYDIKMVKPGGSILHGVLV